MIKNDELLKAKSLFPNKNTYSFSRINCNKNKRVEMLFSKTCASRD